MSQGQRRWKWVAAGLTALLVGCATTTSSADRQAGDAITLDRPPGAEVTASTERHTSNRARLTDARLAAVAPDARQPEPAPERADKPAWRPDAEPHAQLPAAPWSGEPLGRGAAPQPLLESWRQADNRGWCAPLAPRSLGTGAGATVHVVELHGGWSVAFDKPGAKGIAADGTTCTDCGRAAFGIAGTAMTPGDGAAFRQGELGPTFDDGSHASVHSGEGANAATIAISGQGCVYQVWSYLGERHMRQLMHELRFVDVGRAGGHERVAELDR